VAANYPLGSRNANARRASDGRPPRSVPSLTPPGRDLPVRALASEELRRFLRPQAGCKVNLSRYRQVSALRSACAGYDACGRASKSRGREVVAWASGREAGGDADLRQDNRGRRSVELCLRVGKPHRRHPTRGLDIRGSRHEESIELRSRIGIGWHEGCTGGYRRGEIGHAGIAEAGKVYDGPWGR
jgi:hypothetical protein